MGKKFSGVNSKAVEARERKANAKREQQKEKEKAKEDALWEDDNKRQAKKEKKKKEQEEKRVQAQQRKEEAKAQEEKEREEITKKYGAKGAQKVTRAEIERQKEREAAQKRREEEKRKKKKKEGEEDEEAPIEENINHILREQQLEDGVIVNARSVSEALEQISVEDEGDKHPEKRMKAAYRAYEAEHLSVLRKENPSLKLSQLKEMLWKQWQKAPENPLNK